MLFRTRLPLCGGRNTHVSYMVLDIGVGIMLGTMIIQACFSESRWELLLQYRVQNTEPRVYIVVLGEREMIEK